MPFCTSHSYGRHLWATLVLCFDIQLMDKSDKDVLNGRHVVDWNQYLSEKRNKLLRQLNNDSENGCHLFSGLCFYINGVTNPSEMTLKKLIISSGGMYLNHFDAKRTTHTIASNLAFAKTKNSKQMVVKPEWITDSIEAKELLSAEEYLVIKRDPTITRALRVDSSAPIDPQFLKALPEELRNDVLADFECNKRKKCSKNAKNVSIDDMFKRIRRQANGGLLTSAVSANICGKSDAKEVMNLIEEWINTEEELMDEDIAYVTKYLLDLIDERAFERLEAVCLKLHACVRDRDQVLWKECFDDMRQTVIAELKDNEEVVSRLPCFEITSKDL